MVELSQMKTGEAQDTYELIMRVFRKHVAPVYSEKGIARFLGMLSQTGLSEMNHGEDSFVIVARDHTKIIGMLSVINKNHIALIFVDSYYQGKGIGKNLIDEAIKKCSGRNSGITAVTVSSSPNSESFYKETGFEATGDEIDDEGLRFTPMRKLL